VVRVDGPGEPERHPGELRLHGRDDRVDLVAAGHLGHRVDVTAVGGPDLVDESAPRRRVGLVPGGDVLLGQFGEIGHEGCSCLPAAGTCCAGRCFEDQAGRAGGRLPGR
jgi:hypothetical protein